MSLRYREMNASFYLFQGLSNPDTFSPGGIFASFLFFRRLAWPSSMHRDASEDPITKPTTFLLQWESRKRESHWRNFPRGKSSLKTLFLLCQSTLEEKQFHKFFSRKFFRGKKIFFIWPYSAFSREIFFSRTFLFVFARWKSKKSFFRLWHFENFVTKISEIFIAGSSFIVQRRSESRLMEQIGIKRVEYKAVSASFSTRGRKRDRVSLFSWPPFCRGVNRVGGERGKFPPPAIYEIGISATSARSNWVLF